MRRPVFIALAFVIVFGWICPAGQVSVAYADAPNLLVNGSFENGMAGWNWSISGGALASATVMTGDGHDGTAFVRLKNDSNRADNVYGKIGQTVSVKPYTQYTVSLWARTENANFAIYGSWDLRVSLDEDSSGEWKYYETTFVTENTTTWKFFVLVQDITSRLEIDGIVIRETNAVDNGGFENNLNGWTAWSSGGASASFSIRTDGPKEGNKYVRITNGSGYAPNVYGHLYQTIAVQPNSIYVITLWARTSGANHCWFGGWDERFALDVNSAGVWKQYKATIYTGAQTSWQFNIVTENATVALDVDGIRIEKTGNLLNNGSFEASPDLAGWSPVFNGGAQGSITVRSDGAFANRKYARITNDSSLSPHVYVALEQDVPVKPNTEYLISLRARTDGAKQAWYGGGPSWLSRFSFVQNSNGQWLKYEAKIRTGNETVWQFVVLSEDTTTLLDIDEVLFVEANRIVNPGFERDLEFWAHGGSAQASISILTDSPYEGNRYVRMTNSSPFAPGVYAFVQQQIPVEPFSSYTITLRARTSGVNDAYFGGGPNWETRFPFHPNSGGVWKEYRRTFTTGPETSWPFIIVVQDVATALDIDAVIVEKVPLNAPGLQGEAIWYPEVDYPVTLAPARAERYFRKTFHLTQLPEKAALTFYAQLAAKVYVNGVPIEQLLLAEPDARVYDVTDVLTTGTNVIAVQARTWAPGDDYTSADYWDRPLNETLYRSYAMITADLDLTNDDGTQVKAAYTDSTWKVSKVPAANWTAVHFDDTAWLPAQVVGPFPAKPWTGYVASDLENRYAGLLFSADPKSMHFQKGDAKSVRLTLSAWKLPHPVSSANLYFTVKDAHGHVIQTGMLPNVPFSGKKADAVVPLNVDEIGFYTVELSAVAYHENDAYSVYVMNRVQHNNTFSFLVNDLPVDVALSDFGVTNHGGDGSILRNLGIGWLRTDISWERLQFEDGGTIHWEDFDQRLNNAASNGLSSLVILDYSPIWASTAPASVSDWEKFHYRPDLAKWLNFVDAAVRRYKHLVRYWEIWNEPDGGFWQSPKSEYVDFLRETSIRIKSIDPSAQIVVGGLVMGSGFLEMLYQNGLKNHFDVINLHAYAQPLAPEMYLAEKINDFKSVAAAYGDGAKPIWITEVGTPTGGPLRVNDEVQAQFFVRSNVLALANGIEKSMWYNDTGVRGSFDYDFGIMLGRNHEPKAAAQAAAIMTKYLNGAVYVSSLYPGDPFIHAYQFAKGASQRYVLWSAGSPSVRTIDFGATKVTKVDMYGAAETLTSANGQFTLTLTQSPIYIIK